MKSKHSPFTRLYETGDRRREQLKNPLKEPVVVGDEGLDDFELAIHVGKVRVALEARRTNENEK